MKKSKSNMHKQRDGFIEAARSLGCDEDPVHFDVMLKKVARHKPPPEAHKTMDHDKVPGTKK